ncbi:hypothetical protein HXX76_014189 [Chlamydomonas incerta]|uniref:EGF-like domain-containing protein n=1 Tax=Chlamydomonas incerta TaxID=51695 RepID=A0A835VR75_CHLIN|nr:hypothetical protein HXX76_014189 [Chlamydomonas incerta]|eukprot:KAG2424765.1 hypothetical protein HXX76_014189 [Chlamydomonas incerta]
MSHWRAAAALGPLLLAVALLHGGLALFTDEEVLMYREMDERMLSSQQPLTQSLLSSAAVLDGHHAFGGAAAAAGGSSSAGAGSSGRSLLQVSDDAATEAWTLPPLPTTPAEHCQATIGSWCGPYFQQTPTQRPPPPRGSKECPSTQFGPCNGVGQCQYDFGLCYCPVGWGGPDCSQPRKRPCWRMGADKRDEGWHKYPEWSHSRCAGLCDDDDSMCYCPPETKFGRQLAPAGSAPGAAPLKIGRPMYWCQPSTDKEGAKVSWGAVRYEDLYGPNGWCNGEVPSFHCPCRHDGMIGALCNIAVEQFCPNQCSGRGECDQGFCRCHKGWYGHDCSRLRAGLPYSEEPDYVAKKPWLEPAVSPPVAAEDPPRTAPTRRRPYIYVYDVKPDYSSDILQYRIERAHCNYRQFELANASSWIHYNAYALESVLHEVMLASEHRTFDPEEADYFYVPIMWSCLFDVYGWNPIPRWPADVHGPRPYAAAMMQKLTAEWLNATFPYWKKRGGRDHIWLTATDEGACMVWRQVWPGIMLSHWGRTEFPHKPNSQYHADNYGHSIVHTEHDGEWLKDTSQAHPCFDPAKDLVVPAFKRSGHFARSPYLGAPQPARDIFAFFRGDLRIAPGQDPDCKYSRCIRQTLFNQSLAEGWKDKYNVLFGDTRHVHGDYSSLLARSVFCFVLPGDGWSPRLEDAILHGCIPVIIMDQVQVVFESILDVPNFSVRVAQKDMKEVINILKAVPADRIKAMQANLAKVWMRYRWLGVKMADKDAREVVSGHAAQNGGAVRPNPGAQFGAVREDDAFSTLMQWLYARIPEVTGKSI